MPLNRVCFFQRQVQSLASLSWKCLRISVHPPSHTAAKKIPLESLAASRSRTGAGDSSNVDLNAAANGPPNAACQC